jgi:hypothetical protein
VARWLRVATAVLFVAAAAAAAAQLRPPDRPRTDIAYDGRFTFVRLRWKSDFAGARRGFVSAWDHDYPRAEQHLSQILDELTGLDIRAFSVRRVE